MTTNIFAIAGLVYDIVGAVVLAEAIAATRIAGLASQARNHGQFSTGNLALFAALEDQRHDARFGLGLLVTGFALQLLAALGYAWATTWSSGVLSAVPLVVVLSAWQILTCRLAGSRLQRYLDTLESDLMRMNFIRHNPEEPPSTVCVRLERILRIRWRQQPAARGSNDALK